MDGTTDFELLIERTETGYRARVLKSPAGTGVGPFFDLPLEAELEDLREALRSSPPGGGRHLGMDRSPGEGSKKYLGRWLFERVFAGQVLEAWQASVRVESNLLLRLRLDDDPLLLSIPWELLFDPKQSVFVATKMRVVRSLDLPTEDRSLGVPPPLRILVVLSCPQAVARLETEKEWAVLDHALGERVQLTIVPPRLEEVDRALQSGEWHILHFVGHGNVEEEGGCLILEDQHGEAWSVDHLRLGRFLSHPSLRLVVLNACEGALPGGSDAFSGVAQALLREGVPAVLAMQQVISDSAAIAFSKHFYGAFGQGLTLGSALLEARRALYRDDEPEWAIPVLYLSTPDAPLIGDPLLPPSKTWILYLVGAFVGVLLLAVLMPFFSDSPKPPEDQRPPPKPPRGAERNPKECPSPEGLNMAFIRIEPGLFEMGESGGPDDDEPAHQVRITRPFCIGVYEVTQEQWNRAVGNAPPPQDLYLPVREVRYDDVQDLIRLLNEKDPGHHYRLPTEAEWEYVARGRTQMMYSFLDDAATLVRHANCGESGDGFDGLTWVGQFPANRWGVHDMYGNVFEWVSDWYGPYSAEDVVDPLGPLEGDRRIRRGGSWRSSAAACSSAARSIVKKNRRDKETGFRIVREIR